MSNNNSNLKEFCKTVRIVSMTLWVTLQTFCMVYTWHHNSDLRNWITKTIIQEGIGDAGRAIGKSFVWVWHQIPGNG